MSYKILSFTSEKCLSFFLFVPNKGDDESKKTTFATNLKIMGKNCASRITVKAILFLLNYC